MNGLTLTENQSLFFQAEDKDGNIIAKNSLSIYGIGKMNPDNFEVSFEKTDNYVTFIPRLKHNGHIYNDIYCKIANVDYNKIQVAKEKDDAVSFKNYVEEFKNFYNIGDGMPWSVHNVSMDDLNLKIYFEVRNKVTAQVMVTKNYDFSLYTSSSPTIDGGVINEGKDDEQIMTPDNDKNIDNDSLNVDWSLENSVDNIKNFFGITKEFFNLIILFLKDLPSWIVVPLYTLFILAIIIFVFHVIRG